MKSPSDDAAYMRVALGLARRGLGNVAPNPTVGCVLTHDGIVVGRGWTQPGGRPHAETVALAQAGGRARGATAYVTLEPCSHHGQTPPCAEALVAAGVRRCVVAIEDPDPRVSGKGIQLLQDAGIAVELGVLADDAAALNAGFLSRISQERPLVTLKLATTLDGRIATHGGESQWITGPEARRVGHLLRYHNDAIVIGSGTALSDDPELTIRIAGLEASEKPRIVVDGRLRTPLTGKLVRQAQQRPTLIVTLSGGDAPRRQAFLQSGIELIDVGADSDGLLDLREAFRLLAKRGLTRLLVEGGSTVAASLLRHGLVDHIAWFHSATLVGGDGLAAIKAFGVDRLAQQVSMIRLSILPMGEDILETFKVISGGTMRGG